jgi:hypothetical protein
MAGVISAEFSGDIAEAIESILGQRVTGVLVLPHRTSRR